MAKNIKEPIEEIVEETPIVEEVAEPIVEATSMTYSINIGDFKQGETTHQNRCLSANYGMLTNAIPSATIPWENEQKEVLHNPWDYKYEDGEFVLDVIEIPTPTPTPTPTQLDRIESQVMWTALCTDTLIESEAE